MRAWAIAGVALLVVAGIAAGATGAFLTGRKARSSSAINSDPTGTYTVVRQTLSAQTEVPATLGYAGSYTVAVPSGSSAAQVAQAQQAVAQDELSLSADEQSAADGTSADGPTQAAAQVQLDTTKLQGDQTTLASLQATQTSPGTIFTALPVVGEVIDEDQPLYSLTNEPVVLLYGPVPASRAFYLGMSDGPDVGELTQDLIALGFGAELTQSDHFSQATATSVEAWQSALGLPATGEVLLGEVFVLPGPIRVTSVMPSLGQSLGGGGASGGGDVLTSTSTTRQVSIALDASQQAEVAAGDGVTITLPNNQTTPGVVSSVGTVATAAPSSNSGNSGPSSPTVTVLVDPTDPAATGEWDEAPVNVLITTATVNDALVVPVDALHAGTGGGYAVEVADLGGRRHLVGVGLGLFDDADGLVQVTATTLSAGQRVVVPQL